MSVSDVKTQMKGQYCKQFGKEVLVTQLPFRVLNSIFEIDEDVQRKLDIRRRSEIREFILKAVEEETFYFSPFVFSARGNIQEGEKNTWEVKTGAKLYILDGQHRMKAMASAIGQLERKKELLEELTNDAIEIEKIQRKIDRLKSFPIAMQVYLNLSKEEDQQLFADINSERKEAHYGLIMQYDQRDPYNELTRAVANELNTELEIEMQKSRLTVQNSSITSLTIIRRCLLALFEGILTVKSGEPRFKNCEPEEVPIIAKAFLKSWLEIFPRKMHDRTQFVCGLTGPQVALAYTVYQLTKNQNMPYDFAINQLKKISDTCSWRHDDPLFRDFYEPASRRMKRHSSTTAIKKLSSIFIKLINEENKDVLAND
ncbi:DNA sulfur modification protein DndB [Pueribacillus sp. YX66]|uniref:DNA sulfur modification protein DndB n=1 Tax=Pueribacillus sp. YX66 TaxID=3229242 RepID=UPI00358CE4A2